MRPVRCVISPTAGVMRVVDDDQVVVGVERQLVGIERPLGLRAASAVRASAKAPGMCQNAGSAKPGGGDRQAS